MRYAVLVVDDIESIRFAIKDFLGRDFTVFEAESGYQALEVLESNKIDMIITDIRMPGMGGLDLIRAASEKYPHIKSALMTAYSVNDYIKFARREKVWNIIPKTTFLDLRHIRIMIEKNLTGDIFGVEKYFPAVQTERITLPVLHRMSRKDTYEKLKKDVLYQFRVTTFEENEKLCEMAGELLIRSGAPSIIRHVLEELSTNAMLRAPRNVHGKPKFHFQVRASDTLIPIENIRLEEEDSFDVFFGIAEESGVVCVRDFHGSLDREEILYRLERHVTSDPSTGLPVGVSDTHGRGLFISREHVDHLIFNIDPGKCTEVIAILSVEGGLRNRALSIYQIDPS